MKSHARRLNVFAGATVALGTVCAALACSGEDAQPKVDTGMTGVATGNGGTGMTGSAATTTASGTGNTSTTTTMGDGGSTAAGMNGGGSPTTVTMGGGATSTGAGGSTAMGGSGGTTGLPDMMNGGATSNGGSTEVDVGAGGNDMGGAMNGGGMDGGGGADTSAAGAGMDTGPMCGNGMVEEGEECDGGEACNDDCTAAGPTLPTIEELFPAGDAGPLDGTLRITACGEQNSNGTDCGSDGGYLIRPGGEATKINCQGALDLRHDFPVAGDEGTTYTVTMHFYGIMEPKNYGQGVQRDAPQRPGNQDDGADPTPFATAGPGHSYPTSDYNTYEVHVFDAGDQEVARYYMNADTSEGHWSYVIDYEKQIQVIGGGRIHTRVYDRNCRQIKNCGPNGTSSQQCGNAADSRVIDMSGVDPAPANAFADQGGLTQPALVSSRDSGSAGQWWLIDVVSVDSME